jgi:NAD(P)-dependent dehydrogenase (short-subunit alcohol dehydrogenase family)
MSIFQPDVLAEQHIVISGGVGAIGLGVIKGLVAHGARVTVNDLVSADIATERLSNAGVDPGSVRYIQADMADEEAVINLVETARQQQGPINTAICHAAVAISDDLIDFSIENWDRTMDANVKSAFLLARTVARNMIAEDRAGHLVFTTSWVADFSWPVVGPYNISKAAMNHLMRCLARELAGNNIRANALAPGVVDVGMAKHQWNTEPDFRARVEKAIPLGEMQSLESVVDAFIFLCSPAASYMTGTVLLVDGGCSLYPLD